MVGMEAKKRPAKFDDPAEEMPIKGERNRSGCKKKKAVRYIGEKKMRAKRRHQGRLLKGRSIIGNEECAREDSQEKNKTQHFFKKEKKNNRGPIIRKR